MLLKAQKKQELNEPTTTEDETYTGDIRLFGDENMTPLTDHLLGCLFLELEIVELVMQLRFNPDYPENKNVRKIHSTVNTGGATHTITTFKVFTDDGWQPRSLQDICCQMIQQSARIFKKYYANNYTTILERDMTEHEFNEYAETIERILDSDQTIVQKYCVELQERLRAL